jgi:Ca2+-binding EF-hand superfamily protein
MGHVWYDSRRIRGLPGDALVPLAPVAPIGEIANHPQGAAPLAQYEGRWFQNTLLVMLASLSDDDGLVDCRSRVDQPHGPEIAGAGAWPGCDRCRRSFASGVMAVITFSFQTSVAGDSGGYIAIPVIERRPYTAIIFVGSLRTGLFGVLNLIVAVVVDVSAESRDKVFYSRAEELEKEETELKQVLERILNKIDSNHDGAWTCEELVQGAGQVAKFGRGLRVMDFGARDLELLFQIVDEDNSGVIDPAEFIEAMYRMKTADSKTATTFVKHSVTRIVEGHKELNDRLKKMLEAQPKMQ